jgi:hypothetical protein
MNYLKNTLLFHFSVHLWTFVAALIIIIPTALVSSIQVSNLIYDEFYSYINAGLIDKI